MGAFYQYRCFRCGYATLGGGGTSCGRFTRFQTYFCFSCRSLHDYNVTQSAPLECPCGSTLMVPWDEKAGCPRCRKPMRKRLRELFD